ncbi:MAG TPA: ABC transporter permease subunit [Polyangiaceae bacterium]|nr:ABC transporter permease subunit [Polyangiaceae bacterium]
MPQRPAHVQAIRVGLANVRGLSDLRSEALDAVLLAAEEGETDDGQLVYGETEPVTHLYVVQNGRIRLERVGSSAEPVRVGPGQTFGRHVLAGVRGERATSEGPSSLVRIPEAALLEALAGKPGRPQSLQAPIGGPAPAVEGATRRARAAAQGLLRSLGGNALQCLRSPAPYRRLLGYALFFGSWYLAVEAWALPHFNRLPGITEVVHEWLSKDPTFGLSIYTPEYYAHIGSSLRRVGIAFLLATAAGVPIGLGLGASTTFREYVFPVFELLRPVPIPAWIPLAILVFSGAEAPIVFLTLLASFFATALNTFLGVRSIDSKYVLAARCLGATPWQVFRHVIVPGSLPFVLTGLQISMGVAWFSIAAAEMCSGQFGLGYVINTSYTMVKFPTIVIGMLTLGVLGFLTSAIVRLLGERLVVWRARELSMERP